MNHSEIVATAKAIKAKVLKDASANMDPGTYQVDMLVRILGSFTKGEDYQTKIPAKINWQLAFALSLSKMNKETRAAVIKLVLEAMAAGKESPEHKALADQVKAEVQPALDEMKGETTVTASGKVTAALTAEVVGGSSKVERIG